MFCGVFSLVKRVKKSTIFSNEMEKKPRYYTYFSIEFGKNYFLSYSHTQANIQTLKINDGSTKMRLTGHFKSVTGLSFSRGRFELFSGSLDRAILIWDCDRTKEILFSEENRDDHRKRGMNSISSMRSLFDDGYQMNLFIKTNS